MLNHALGAAPVPGHDGYIATRGGLILSTKSWQGVPIRALRAQAHRDGHMRISLTGRRCSECGGKSNKLEYVHSLILETFIGPKPPDGICRHLNSVPSDNRAENLAWGTPQQNMDDRARRGLYYRGEANHKAKLTAAKVEKIRQLRRGGWTLLRLAERFRICQSQAHNICAGKQWR